MPQWFTKLPKWAKILLIVLGFGLISCVISNPAGAARVVKEVWFPEIGHILSAIFTFLITLIS